MGQYDDNDRLKDGALPEDPFEDAVRLPDAPDQSEPGSSAPTTAPRVTSTPVRAGQHELWPAPLGEDAYHGLAGDVIRTIEPHSEADPVGLLLQFLVTLGCIVGRGAYFLVEDAAQYLNEFMVLVGRTSKGRKGTALGRVMQLLGAVAPGWVRAEGLSSGEGLIYKVRDPIEKREYIREKGRITGHQTVVSDGGVADKRLLVSEGEFASPLKVMTREGNTLSPILRIAWDHGNLESLVKNSPIKATGAHVNLIGHITQEELLRHLDQTEMANGFANRIIWALVRRSKMLPEGGHIPPERVQSLVDRLNKVVAFGREAAEIRKDDAARELWRTVYPVLSEGKPGLVGAIINRAEAHVMRLACVYAILDKSSVITVSHLKAALALWKYCEESVQVIFGKKTGDPLADRLYFLLLRMPGSMTRTEIQDHFSGHKKEEDLTRALRLLESFGLVRMEKHETAGRPVERWLAADGPAK